MLIFNNICIRNKKIYLNKLSNNNNLCLIKRFTGDKPIGHVHKMINALILAESIKNLNKNKAIVTPLPQRVLEHLKIDHGKKSMAYLMFIYNEIFIFPRITDNSLFVEYYKNTQKNNIICGRIASVKDSNNIIKKTFNNADLTKDLLVKQAIAFLFNQELPGTPIVRLGILQRFNITPKVSRGAIFEIITSFINNSSDY